MKVHTSQKGLARFLLICTLAVGILWGVGFILFKVAGPLVIASAYHQTFPMAIVNSLIRGQHLHDLGYYLQYADRFFISASALLLRCYVVIVAGGGFAIWLGRTKFEYRTQTQSTLVLLVISLVLIFAGDQMLGWAFRIPEDRPNIWQERFIRLKKFSPNISEHRRPRADHVAETDGLEPKQYRLRTDELGFIMPTRKHESPDLTLFFIGGSTTECIFVEEMKRFPSAVGNIIEKETHLKVNAYNSGVSGNNSLHSLDILMNQILPLKPDMVMMMHNLNDMVVLLYTGTYWNDNFNKSPIVEKRMVTDRPPTFLSLSNDLLRYMVPHSHHRVRSALSRPPADADEWADIRGTELTYDVQDMASEFERMLRTFVAICKLRHITPVLMTQQSRFRENPDEFVQKRMQKMSEDFGIAYDEFRAIYEMFNERIRAVARHEDIQWIDLDREIPKTREFMYDVIHFNDRGSLLAAKIIADELIREAIVPNHTNDQQ